MALITYEDKDNSLPTSNPRRLFRDVDANEIKNVVNANAAGSVQSVTGDGVDNTDPANPVVNVNTVLREGRTVTGADACVQTDDNTIIRFNSATPFNFTIDTLTLGTKFSWINYGAGAVTLVNGAGVTIDGDTSIPGAVSPTFPAGVIDFGLSATAPKSITGSNQGVTYWQTLPGTPTRVSDTQLTITDTANANLYNLKFGRGTVLKWTDTTTHLAMVSSASYSSNTVTINIIGDVLSGTATMSSFTFGLEKALVITRAIAGTLATGTNLTAKYFAPMSMKVFGGKAFHGTAGTTNATTYDINKNGSTMFTTKLSVASAATVGTVTTADDNITLAADDVLTYDCNSVSTTAPIDAYIDLYVMPLNNQYL